MEEIKKYKHKIDSTDVNFAKHICGNKKYTVCKTVDEYTLKAYISEIWDKHKLPFEELLVYLDWNELIIECGNIVNFDIQENGEVGYYYSLNPETLKGFKIQGDCLIAKQYNGYKDSWYFYYNYYLSKKKLRSLLRNRILKFYYNFRYGVYDDHPVITTDSSLLGLMRHHFNELSQNLKCKKDIELLKNVKKLTEPDMPQCYRAKYYPKYLEERNIIFREKIIHWEDLECVFSYNVDHLDGKWINLRILIPTNYYSNKVKIQKLYKFYEPIEFVALDGKENPKKFVKF